MSSDAEPGAVPAGISIPLAVPHLGGREWDYVKEALDSGWVSSAGPFVDRFETAISARLGGHAVATTSGTAALHVALLVAGVRPDDEVIVPDLTFVAPANAVRYCGAWPVLVDVDPKHWQMDVDRLGAFLERGCRVVDGALRDERSGRRVSAVLPVGLLGHPCDMDRIVELARAFGLAVVEDATETLGATYRGRPAGLLGDIGCLSFNGNKVITSGGGGMILTREAAAASRARYLTTQAKDDPIEFVHEEIGFNYRLSSLQAAVGVAQLERLDDHLAAKRAIVERYRAGLGDVAGLTMQTEAPWARSSNWLFTIRVDPTRAGIDSRSLLKVLERRGIQSRPLWTPMHRLRAFRLCVREDVTVADVLYRECLSIPSSVGLRPEEQSLVIDVVREACLVGAPA